MHRNRRMKGQLVSKLKVIIALLGTTILLSIFIIMKKNEPKFSIIPEHALLDQTLEISISNLRPHETVTFELSSKNKDNDLWRSSALFKANDSGIVNLVQQAPLSGSYSSIDPMGLFWSMKPTSKEPSKNTFLSLCTLNIPEVTLSVFYNNKLIAQKTIRRLVISPNVERKEIRDEGIVGTLFYPKSTKKNPGIIAIPGSGGVIPGHVAQLLASHGYTVLALAYFGYEGLPKNLSLIPLEYFLNAMRWLKKQSQVDDKIAILGHSRGAEAVLLLASLFPEEMDAVIAISASHLVYGDFSLEKKSAWTYKNKPLPFMPYLSDKEIAKAGKEGFIILHKGTIEDPFQDSEIFLHGIKKYDSIVNETTIPVENIRCPLLIISGNDDKMWPSSFAGNKIIKWLDSHDSTIEKKHINYPNAGHNLFIFPYIPSIDLPVPIAAGWSLFGGTPDGNASAQKAAWHEILNFLLKYLQKRVDKQ